MIKKLFKEHKGLVIYSIIILILLFVILFVLDDDFIKKHSSFKNFFNQTTASNNEQSTKDKFANYEDQIKALEQNKFKYKYEIDYNGTYYQCEGTKNKEEDNGSCTKPEQVTYTKDNFAEVYSKINTKFLDVKYIFDSLKEYEPKEEKYGEERVFVYTIKTTNGTNEISIYTDYENITKICIAKGYLTYILNYSDIGI